MATSGCHRSCLTFGQLGRNPILNTSRGNYLRPIHLQLPGASPDLQLK